VQTGSGTDSDVTEYDAGGNTYNIHSDAANNPQGQSIETDLPSITSQPQDAQALRCQSGNASFSVTANSEWAISYQWQENNGSGWANVSNGGDYAGATTSTLTITPSTDVYEGPPDYQYRAQATTIYGTTTSNAATLDVEDALTVGTQPSNVSNADAGESVSFTSHASSSNETTGSETDHEVQWQVNDGSGWSNIPGATSDTLTFTAMPSDNNNQYRAVFTNECSPVNSNAATLTVASTSVSVSKTVSKKKVAIGHNFSYTVTVDKSGSGDAHDLTMTDNLPGNVSFVSMSQSGSFAPDNCSHTAHQVKCTWADPDSTTGSEDITITVHATDLGKATNTASLTTDADNTSGATSASASAKVIHD
jgi:uncharacterized repeat protein (TIGR01451 family)